MEGAGLALSAVQSLLAALQCPQLNDILSIFGYKSQLDDLQDTVQFLKSVLSDAADIKQELLNSQDKVQIDKIMDAVYEADDLFDEFVTLVQQKQQLEDDGRVSEKLRSFFSLSNNPASIAYRMSHGVKKIKKKLDAIATYNQFSFKHDPQPIRIRSRDTCDYVNKVDIVGRGGDLEKIVGMLLDDQRPSVSFLSVVGLGGLGKTTLAQLVFHDPRVKNAFSWRNWTCVADQDQKELDVAEVLCKILGWEGSSLQQVQSQLREKLAGVRYLLVLDDVWTEKQIQWRELVKYLIGGQRGSWIVVTTRSHTTAEIVGGEVHKLQGLSEENSWSLFQQSAFTSNQSSNPPDELVEIGRKIVEKCGGVPLAIKVVGSFLYGQDRGKWKLVQETGLANIRQSDNYVLPILKLSFHHLEAPLKSCFAYCALFPKDFEMDKEMLKSLWMAQGYVVPLDEGQSIEDACDEYFSILLRRCFFQDIKKDKHGEITSCKIHDLIHDIALDVSGKEIFCATNTIEGYLDKKVRHLVTRLENMREPGNYSLFGKSRIRSYLHIHDILYPEDAIYIVANCRFLRALDLTVLGIKSLPSCIGELLHLRYLDLSYNRWLKVLPKSFTKLYNLQTLKLDGCKSLRELPKNFSRLVNLRLLDVDRCDSLTYMPQGMGKLSSLHRLSDFKVGGGGISSSWEQWFDSLDDLKALNKLKGRLDIEIRWPKRERNIVKEDGDKREGLYMRNKEHLNVTRFYFEHEEGDDGGKDEELSLMEDLQPHSNLEWLTIWGYNGVKMPGWLTLVQNIISLELYDCGELGYLPCMGNLCHLKYISLRNLAKLEYIGVDDSSWENSNTTMPMSGLGSCDKELSFFPSLQQVYLLMLPKLKGWKRGIVGRVEDNNSGNNLQSQQLLPCFSKLQTLTMYDCPELTSLPSCPGLEELILEKFNQGLQIMNKKRDEVAPASSSASTSGYEIVNPKLLSLDIDNMAWPNSLPSEYFHRVKTLTLSWLGNEEVDVDLPDWMQFLPALQTLKFDRCRELKAIPKWMPKLTSLTTLRLHRSSESLKRRCKKDPPGDDWPYIQHIPDIQFIGYYG